MSRKSALSDKARATREGSAGWRIQVVAQGLARDMQARLGLLGLKQDQFALLMTLAETENLTQSDLGKRLGMPNYTVTRALDGLETHGLIERRPDRASRRAHRVFLTEAGEALMPEVFAIVTQVNAALLSGLDDTAQEAFLTALGQLLTARRPTGA